MSRLGEIVGEAVGSGINDIDIEKQEAEFALTSCEEGLAKRFDSRLGGKQRTLLHGLPQICMLLKSVLF